MQETRLIAFHLKDLAWEWLETDLCKWFLHMGKMEMCLAIPAEVKEINGDTARVDFGGGVLRDVNISLVDVQVGEYVLVHVGYAIQVIDRKAAQETLQLWREILQAEPSSL